MSRVPEGVTTREWETWLSCRVWARSWEQRRGMWSWTARTWVKSRTCFFFQCVDI